MSDLLVIGAGHLGARVASIWKVKFPESQIFLKTKSDNQERSEKWRKLGFQPVAGTDAQGIKCPYVVYSVPPTAEDAATSYVQDIDDSLNNHWSQDGAFVFTSSGGVFAENEGNVIDENSQVSNCTSTVRTAHGSGTKIILDGEAKVLSHKNGFVLRLGGLYTTFRGAHNFWLKSGRSEFPSSGNGLINLIHYDDAADSVVAALLADRDSFSERLFIVSDGVPTSRQDIALVTSKNPLFADSTCPTFTGGDNVDGKKYNTSRLNKILKWKPTFESFKQFMEEGYKNEKKSELLDN